MQVEKIVNPTDGAESLVYKNIILDPVPGTNQYCVQVNYPGLNRIKILNQTASCLQEAMRYVLLPR